MTQYWAVRLGESGKYVKPAINGNFIAIGWEDLGDLSQIADRNVSDDEVREILKKKYVSTYRNESNIQIGLNCGTVFKFVNEMQIGDIVLTPYGDTVLFARIVSDYKYKDDWSDECEYRHRREVKWLGETSRSSLPDKLRSALKSWLTVFKLDEYGSEIDAIIAEISKEETKTKVLTRNELIEYIINKCNEMKPREFEKFITSLLGILGFEVTTTQATRDGSVDVIGVLNAEGLAEIKLKVQVKRTVGNVGVSTVRELRGTLGPDEHGAVITTSKFTRDAQEDANKAGLKPIMLIDGNELAELILRFYEHLSEEYKQYFNLKRRSIPLNEQYFVGGTS